jgi:hypothetical protein
LIEDNDILGNGLVNSPSAGVYASGIRVTIRDDKLFNEINVTIDGVTGGATVIDNVFALNCDVYNPGSRPLVGGVVGNVEHANVCED